MDKEFELKNINKKNGLMRFHLSKDDKLKYDIFKVKEYIEWFPKEAFKLYLDRENVEIRIGKQFIPYLLDLPSKRYISMSKDEVLDKIYKDILNLLELS